MRNERKRKSTDVLSEARDKRIKADAEAAKSLLSNDLIEANSINGIALVLPGKKSKPSEQEVAAAKVMNQLQQKRLNSKQKKRLQKIVERKDKINRREGLLAALADSQLTHEQALLLQSTSRLGQKTETTKQRLGRELREQRAGLVIDHPEDAGKKGLLVAHELPSAPALESPKPSGSALAAKPGAGLAKPGSALAPAKAKLTVVQPAGPKSVLSPAATEDSEDDSDEDDDVDDESMDDNSDASDAKEDNSAGLSDKHDAIVTSQKPAVPSVAVQPGPALDARVVAKETPPVSAPTPARVFKPAYYMNVERDPVIQEARLRLPILAEEQGIMEMIHDHDVVLICGETGSGKTTQLPQFLYEAGYTHPEAPYRGLIGITEPRRVAAVSMCQRVGKELGLSEKKVSFQIRHEGTTSASTCIKFMTDGVLLKEIESDFLLKKYSSIIVDEAHERSVNTDILIGLLSRIVPLRAREPISKERGIVPLKLIIMSATLRVEDFTLNKQLFPVPPPVFKVGSRQFPVTIHFNKVTPSGDYLKEVFNKVCKVHKKLPAGGVLVFVTGRDEVMALCRKLRGRFPVRKPEMEDPSSETGVNGPGSAASILDKYKVVEGKTGEKHVVESADSLALDELEAGADDDDGDGIEHRFSSDDDDEEDDNKSRRDLAKDKAARKHDEPMHVLPLYALLPKHEQMKVFAPPPEGHRLCVIATNVAETSLTIPGVKYVVDSGKVKQKVYDDQTGISAFQVEWTAKASADQRAGRAGRTGPGHCYRLYSSAVFVNSFAQFAAAEIERMPVDGLMLQMKAMGIDNVVNFPFPSPPNQQALREADRLLVSLGAIDATTKRATPLGVLMSKFPVAPRLAKMLVVSRQHGCFPYAVAIVAAMATKELFALQPEILDSIELDEEENTVDVSTLTAEEKKARSTKERALRRAEVAKARKSLHQWVDPDGDIIASLRAVGAFEYANGTEQFALEHHLRFKQMTEVRQLRAQLTRIVQSVNFSTGSPSTASNHADTVIDPRMPPASPLQRKLLRQIILAGLADNVARLETQQAPMHKRSDKSAPPLFRYAYRTTRTAELVYIHPLSFLCQSLTTPPEFAVFHELVETKRIYMKGCTPIEGQWLASICPSQCSYGAPLEQPAPRYNAARDTLLCFMEGAFGPHAWPLPAAELPFPDGPEKVKWFARFFLEGLVLPEMKHWMNHYVSKPLVVLKPWTQERTVALLQPLIDEKIDSKKKLLEKWKKDSKFLLGAVALWIPRQFHEDLAKAWPPVEKQKSNLGKSVQATVEDDGCLSVNVNIDEDVREIDDEDV